MVGSLRKKQAPYINIFREGTNFPTLNYMGVTLSHGRGQRCQGRYNSHDILKDGKSIRGRGNDAKVMVKESIIGGDKVGITSSGDGNTVRSWDIGYFREMMPELDGNVRYRREVILWRFSKQKSLRSFSVCIPTRSDYGRERGNFPFSDLGKGCISTPNWFRKPSKRTR